MSSEKLRKYLGYYQKVLKNDPTNIEARLRLAAIFRELGKNSHAVEEYVTASKLLAKEGLPLEAIAACKAVLELDPTHTEIQFFLARLFAQVPSAAADARIAKPVDGPSTLTLERPKTGEFQRPEPEALDPEHDSIASEATSPIDDDEVADEDDNTSPLDGDEVDRALTAQRLEAQKTGEFEARTDDLGRLERVLETRVAGYGDDTVSGAEVFEESFEVSVFDLESFELDVPSEEIDLAFLEDFEPISEVVTERELSLKRPEVMRVSRDNLPRIPLFSQLSADAFMGLLNHIEFRKVEHGGVLLSDEEDETKTLYVLVRGEASVTRLVDGKLVELDRLQEGEFFGEFRLLTGRSGAATVRAEGPVEVFAISESVVEQIAEDNPEIWDVLWDFYNARMLNNLLASSVMFKGLDGEQRGALADKFFLREVVADDLLLEHGQACENLYLVLLGEVAIERTRHGLTEELAALREGEFFGIASSLDAVPYSADVRAVRDSTLLCLPAEDFRALVKAVPEIESDIDEFVTSRRRLNDAFTSGMTSYGELGLSSSD